MSGLWHWLKHEFHEVIPPTIFFLISFHIVVLDRKLMLRQYGLPRSSTVSATVAALLVAEVMLIADALPFVNCSWSDWSGDYPNVPVRTSPPRT